jgi:quercetin dioxygenase-like cupin family protein
MSQDEITMNTISIENLRPVGGGSPRFEGYQHGATTSFFVVTSPPGQGADKHRHPYDETFVILRGDIEVIADGVQQMVSAGHILVIPANTWHEFKNRSPEPALMVNIHPVSAIIQEDWSPA